MIAATFCRLTINEGYVWPDIDGDVDRLTQATLDAERLLATRGALKPGEKEPEMTVITCEEMAATGHHNMTILHVERDVNGSEELTSVGCSECPKSRKPTKREAFMYWHGRLDGESAERGKQWS